MQEIIIMGHKDSSANYSGDISSTHNVFCLQLYGLADYSLHWLDREKEDITIIRSVATSQHGMISKYTLILLKVSYEIIRGRSDMNWRDLCVSDFVLKWSEVCYG